MDRLSRPPAAFSTPTTKHETNKISNEGGGSTKEERNQDIDRSKEVVEKRVAEITVKDFEENEGGPRGGDVNAVAFHGVGIKRVAVDLARKA